MATIAKKCSVCGKLYKAYNYVDIPVSREDDEDQEYDDDEAIDVEVTEDFEPINFEPNGFEFVTIEEDMDIQYDFDNQDLCPECMEAISNFIDTNTPHASGNPVVLEDVAPGTPIEMVVDIQPSQDLHGYDHPWIGGAGTNKYDESKKTSSLIDENSNVTSSNAWYLSDYCEIPVGTTNVTLSWESSSVYFQGRITAFDSNKSFITGSFKSFAGNVYTHTFDIPSTAKYVRINYSYIIGGTEHQRTNVRLNVGTTDLGYEPYENICPIYPGNGKNLLQVTATSQTINGVTFTVNSDGTVKAVGTSTATTEFRFGRITRDSAKTYYVSGCPKGGSTASYRQTIRFYLNDTPLLTKSDTGDGYKITSVDAPTADEIGISAWIASGQNVDLLYKPMVTESENSIFVPYQGIMVTRTGKNLLNISSEYDTGTTNVPARTYNDGILSISGNVIAANFIFYRQNITEQVKRNGALYCSYHIQSGTNNNLPFRINDYDENGTVAGRRTLPTTVTYQSGHTYEVLLLVGYSAVVGDPINFIGGIQLELGTTATPYEPYQSQTVEVTLNDTVYGGTLNVTTGELVVDRAEKKLIGASGEWWSLQSINDYGIANFQISNALPGLAVGTINPFINNMLPKQASLISNTRTEGIYINDRGLFFARINSERASTVEAFKTWLSNNNLQLVYELAEPLTYQLTPAQIRLLKGSNTIETDAGTLTIKYKKAIEGKMEVES